VEGKADSSRCSLRGSGQAEWQTPGRTRDGGWGDELL